MGRTFNELASLSSSTRTTGTTNSMSIHSPKHFILPLALLQTDGGSSEREKRERRTLDLWSLTGRHEDVGDLYPQTTLDKSEPRGI